MKPRLLAYVEQVALYNALNMLFTYGDVHNSTVLGTTVSNLNCPSDGNNPSSTITIPGGAVQTIGYTSYPNNLGTFDTNNGGRLDGPAYEINAAALSKPLLDAVVTLATVTDGTSNTAMFSEWIKGRNNAGDSGLMQIYKSTDPDNVAAPLATLAAHCQAAPYQAPNKGTDWLTGVSGKGGGYVHIQTPNKKACYYSNSNGSANSSIIGASSNHPGGVNVGFLDGSVRFVKNSVSPTTWWAIATKAGGEVVSADSY
jgi:prepilin-type processing-associated H-X9-DG protein